MRFTEIDSARDAVLYIGQIYNPFGYIKFAFEEDKDWAEKVEHGLIATGTVAIPFHLLTAMSTGGYWANLPPGSAYRAASMKKFSHQLMYNFIRNVAVTGSRVPMVSAPLLLGAPTVVGYSIVSQQASKLESTPGREHEAAGLWQTLSAALTGGFSAGKHGMF